MFPNDPWNYPEQPQAEPAPELTGQNVYAPQEAQPVYAPQEAQPVYTPQETQPVYAPQQAAPQSFVQPFYTPPVEYRQHFHAPKAEEPAPTPPPAYAYPPQPVKKSRGILGKLVAAVLVIALVVGSCFATAAIVDSRWEAQSQHMQLEFREQLEEMQSQINGLTGSSPSPDAYLPGSPLAEAGYLTPGQVYAQNVDAVVMISCEVVYTQFGQTGTGTSTGSGFIISEDGYVVTNHHVVEGANAITIITHTGEEIPAQLVGSDSINDVALLKADAAQLPYVSLGSSSALAVGDQVVAIGNPLGELTSTMTVGYVSGKERAVTTDGVTINMLQTDAAINSGNSGGPLFNMKGQVVGITTAKYSGNSSSGASIEGIGFAIPIDDVMAVVQELREFGYIKTPYMGVTVAEMNADMRILAQAYNMPIGLTVQQVEPDGPALEAGFQVDDIIIALDGKSITSINELSRALRDYEPGDFVTVSVFRAGIRIELEMTLGERPKDLDSTPQIIEPSMPGSGDFD